MGNRPFAPRSRGFFQEKFSITNFTLQEICDSVKCVQTKSSFLDSLITAPCPEPNQPCPPTDYLTEECAAAIRNLLLPSGATAALSTICTGVLGSLPATLSQLLAVLLDVCLFATTKFGFVGGVQLNYQVDLTNFSTQAENLGLTGCVTVSQIITLANNILSTCNMQSSGDIAPILTAMAQDVDVTIIRPSPCP